jgi:metal-sulfur cluster biosynthetic enzyme
MNKTCQSKNSEERLPSEGEVWQALAGILDPEFGVNIVDLGLIYSVSSIRSEIVVVMTLTTPSCPAGSWIYEGVKTALLGLPGATQVNVSLVFDPPWTAEMLSDNARRQLGGVPVKA